MNWINNSYRQLANLDSRISIGYSEICRSKLRKVLGSATERTENESVINILNLNYKTNENIAFVKDSNE